MYLKILFAPKEWLQPHENNLVQLRQDAPDVPVVPLTHQVFAGRACFHSQTLAQPAADSSVRMASIWRQKKSILRNAIQKSADYVTSCAQYKDIHFKYL